MFLIGDVLVSTDVIEEYFCCDCTLCKGLCCIEGDAGAPIAEHEAQEITENLPKLYPFMDKMAIQTVENQEVSYFDQAGERVLSIVNQKDCIFAKRNEAGVCYCLIEKLHEQHKISITKPLSCHLYPIRLTTLRSAEGKNRTGVEYHKWHICQTARKKGTKEGIRLYQFLKAPLIRCFGEEWYKELDLTAQEWYRYCEERHHEKF